ncbi:MAG TPA: DUF1003 domain-containing protein [Micromonosporaceae bacterium]
MAEPRRESRLDQPREPHRVRLPRLTGETFGHFAEDFARFMGTARFIAYMTIFVIVWVTLNIVGLYGFKWDPYPFILLNLFFSTQASYAAPLILLAQNRQADRDRLAMEEDRRRAAMQKADTEYLSREIAALRIAMGEVVTRDFLRSELSRLAEEIDTAAVERRRTERKERRKGGQKVGRRVGADGYDEPYEEFDDEFEDAVDPTSPGAGQSPDSGTDTPGHTRPVSWGGGPRRT